MNRRGQDAQFRPTLPQNGAEEGAASAQGSGSNKTASPAQERSQERAEGEAAADVALKVSAAAARTKSGPADVVRAAGAMRAESSGTGRLRLKVLTGGDESPATSSPAVRQIHHAHTVAAHEIHRAFHGDDKDEGDELARLGSEELSRLNTPDLIEHLKKTDYKGEGAAEAAGELQVWDIQAKLDSIAMRAAPVVEDPRWQRPDDPLPLHDPPPERLHVVREELKLIRRVEDLALPQASSWRPDKPLPNPANADVMREVSRAAHLVADGTWPKSEASRSVFCRWVINHDICQMVLALFWVVFAESFKQSSPDREAALDHCFRAFGHHYAARVINPRYEVVRNKLEHHWGPREERYCSLLPHVTAAAALEVFRTAFPLSAHKFDNPSFRQRLEDVLKAWVAGHLPSLTHPTIVEGSDDEEPVRGGPVPPGATRAVIDAAKLGTPDGSPQQPTKSRGTSGRNHGFKPSATAPAAMRASPEPTLPVQRGPYPWSRCRAVAEATHVGAQQTRRDVHVHTLLGQPSNLSPRRGASASQEFAQGLMHAAETVQAVRRAEYSKSPGGQAAKVGGDGLGTLPEGHPGLQTLTRMVEFREKQAAHKKAYREMQQRLRKSGVEVQAPEGTQRSLPDMDEETDQSVLAAESSHDNLKRGFFAEGAGGGGWARKKWAVGKKGVGGGLAGALLGAVREKKAQDAREAMMDAEEKEEGDKARRISALSDLVRLEDREGAREEEAAQLRRERANAIANRFMAALRHSVQSGLDSQAEEEPSNVVPVVDMPWDAHRKRIMARPEGFPLNGISPAVAVHLQQQGIDTQRFVGAGLLRTEIGQPNRWRKPPVLVKAAAPGDIAFTDPQSGKDRDRAAMTYRERVDAAVTDGGAEAAEKAYRQRRAELVREVTALRQATAAEARDIEKERRTLGQRVDLGSSRASQISKSRWDWRGEMEKVFQRKAEGRPTSSHTHSLQRTVSTATRLARAERMRAERAAAVSGMKPAGEKSTAVALAKPARERKAGEAEKARPRGVDGVLGPLHRDVVDAEVHCRVHKAGGVRSEQQELPPACGVLRFRRHGEYGAVGALRTTRESKRAMMRLHTTT
ncbi:unnamed protein product [Pedinophyceae sp. YPF-701]|nr:unnamed protein product [Pedinophyceae sp. YPF-701]